MKRFLPLLILSNILLGQGITNSFVLGLPELTKYPSNKFVITNYFSYEESFGEYIEKPLEGLKYGYLFDDKGRTIKQWEYNITMNAELFRLIDNTLPNIDTSKIRELSDPGSMALVKVFEYDENNIQRYAETTGYIDTETNTFVSKYDENGYRLLWDKYNQKGKLIGREKIKFLDSNTLIYDIYDKDGEYPLI